MKTITIRLNAAGQPERVEVPRGMELRVVDGEWSASMSNERGREEIRVFDWDHSTHLMSREEGRS